MTASESNAMQRGRTAARDGFTIDTCPYKRRCFRVAWQMGYEAEGQRPTALHEPAHLIREVGDVVRNGAGFDQQGWIVWTIEWDGPLFIARWEAGEFSGSARAPRFALLLVAMTMCAEEDPNVELDAEGARVQEAE
jgi:hypothetical protein